MNTGIPGEHKQRPFTWWHGSSVFWQTGQTWEQFLPNEPALHWIMIREVIWRKEKSANRYLSVAFGTGPAFGETVVNRMRLGVIFQGYLFGRRNGGRHWRRSRCPERSRIVGRSGGPTCLSDSGHHWTDTLDPRSRPRRHIPLQNNTSFSKYKMNHQKI